MTEKRVYKLNDKAPEVKVRSADSKYGPHTFRAHSSRPGGYDGRWDPSNFVVGGQLNVL